MQILAGEYRDICAHFDLIINKFMSGPFSFAGAIPEVNFISAIFAEKGFDCQCEARNIFRSKINQISQIHTPRSRTKIELPTR